MVEQATPADSRPLKVDEAAAMAGISRNAFYAAVKAGTIPSLRIGRTIRIPRRRFLEWLDGGAEAA